MDEVGAGFQAASEVTFSPGDVAGGRYRIVRFLAQGGMGEVYEAKDLELDDQIALKLVRPEMARDRVALERFRREIQIARRVTHPNVCRIFDLELHKGERGEQRLFLTMEFLAGETLEHHLKSKGRLTPEEAAPLILQMAEGLAAAHRVGVIHRDFKPANVGLVPPGPEDTLLSRLQNQTRVVITDFGLAALSAEHGRVIGGGRVTSVGLVVGTAAYMAPEQAEGRELTQAADVYALGVVIFEMLTGKLPHEADSAVQLLMKRVSGNAPSPRIHVPDLDPFWESLVLRCLERDPRARFASAVELVEELTGQTRETTVAVRPPSQPVTVVASPSRRGVLLAGGAALAALGLGGGGYLWKRRTEVAPETSAPKTGALKSVQLTASAGLDLFPSFSPDGNAIAFSSDRGGHFEIFVKQLTPGGREVTLTSDGSQSFQPAFSPDAQQIAFHSRVKGGIWLISAFGGSPRLVVEFGSRPAWSPDGTLLAFQSEPLIDLAPNAAPALPPSTLWVVPVTGGKPRELTRVGTPPGGHGSPSFHPSGKKLLFLSSDSRNSELWELEILSGAVTRLVGDEPTVRDPIYSEDGTSVYYCASPDRENNGVMQLQLEGGKTKTRKTLGMTSLGLGRIRHLALSRDGKKVAYSALSMSSNIWSVPLKDDKPSGPEIPLTAETGRSSRPAYSPDGTRIAYSKFRPGSNEDVWIMDAAGGNERQITTNESFDSRPGWFPDGKSLAFFSNRGARPAIWMHALETGREELLVTLEQEIDSTRLSPDGTLLAFNSNKGGNINVWIVKVPGGEPRQLTHDKDLMGWPCWSPDGKSLAVQARRGADTQIALVPVSGGMPTMLTDEPGTHWPHSFSPDGRSIAYAMSTSKEAFWNIFAIDIATREKTRITDFKKLNAYVRYPAWSPTNAALAFEYAEITGNIWLVEASK